MQRFRFKKGLRFHGEGCLWTLLRELPTHKLQLQNDQGALRQLTKDDLLSLWRSGEWQIDNTCLEEMDDVIYTATPRDLETFTEFQKKGAIRRARYLAELSDQSFKASQPAVQARITEIAAKINDPNPPHPMTIIRWQRRWGQSKDSSQLVDRRCRAGRRPNAAAYAFFERAVDTVFMTRQKKPRTEVLSTLATDIKNFNRQAPADKQVQLPSKTTVYRWLGDMHAYLVDEARQGKRAAGLKYRSASETVEVSRILERVEIDHTPLDLILVDEMTMVPLGRPWLTLAIDRYSRAILGFYLAFHAPSSYSVMRCLKRCVMPKSDLLKVMEGIRNHWPMHGIPIEVVFDNGMDLHSIAVSLICFELGTRVTFCPVGEPYFKGAIERSFGSLNTGLIHQLPGTVFSNIKQRGDYPAEDKAIFTLAQATYLITKWIVDVYHQRKHRSTGETPRDRWCRQLPHTAIEFPAHPDDLDRLVGIPAKRQKITHEGILFETIFYNNSDLQYLSQRLGRRKAVEFKYFEEDVGYIQVWDAQREEYIRVEAIPKFKEYTTGLSRQLHLVTRRWGEKTYGDDWRNESLLQAKADILEFVKQAAKNKKMATRKQAAVLNGIHSDGPLRPNSALDAAVKSRPVPSTYPPEFAQKVDGRPLPKFGINRIAKQKQPLASSRTEL